MKLLLHMPDGNGELAGIYKRAFGNATELYIVTAFLTHWDAGLELNSGCGDFRLVIGKDFGITRKAACKDVLTWLPPPRRWQFLVADRIDGFHPKMAFWRERDGRTYAIVGSSNLTRAAFETNYEANFVNELPATDFERARRWLYRIEKQSVSVSEDWLAKYRERPATVISARHDRGDGSVDAPLVSFQLPRPPGIEDVLRRRRQQMREASKNRSGLKDLFGRCAAGQISSGQFYKELPSYWGHEAGGRLQGSGWERQGAKSDFAHLARSFLRIVDATEEDRDYIVATELDTLHAAEVPARKAFLSEMLCLRFPALYPVLNKPVRKFLEDVQFRPTRGVSEGGSYIDLARKLRFTLLQNPGYPARDLAELDAVIWLKYHK